MLKADLPSEGYSVGRLESSSRAEPYLQEQVMRRLNPWHLAVAALTVALAGCSDNPLKIEGLAATGAALAGADVTAQCVQGPVVSGKTDANGMFVLSLDGGQALPCVVKASKGNVTLHSFAAAEGRLNVTPLTDLVVSRALGESPATALANGLSAASAAKLSQGLDAAKAAIKGLAEAATGRSLETDPFTGALVVGQGDDLVLDDLQSVLADLGVSLDQLQSRVADGKSRLGRVTVVGDSLSDSGTFGLKFTVQGSAAAGTGSSSIWPELVASEYQDEALCAYFVFTGSSFDTQQGCRNYAIGGGRVNTNPVDPRSIPLQLQTAATIQGYFKASDLLLVDGGGNDAADLAGAYLAISSDGGKAYSDLLITLLDQSAVIAALGQGPVGAATIGGAYMQALADKFADDITTYGVDKGARVLVINVPDIALTPRFSAVLLGVAQRAGAGGDVVAGQVKALIQGWVDAFNARLAQRFDGSDRVAVVDFNTNFRDQVANPSKYGLTDATGTACPIERFDSDTGLPEYNFPTCTAAALSDAPPAGATGGADWWKTYLFSDGFHPTPKGHELAAAEVMKVLNARGW
jgi:phospholipase/lecithinase/hemolysin